MTEPLSMLPIPLLQWYRENARDLPWRRESTPYRVWVSEIMLQQTRVGAVLGYFANFMAAFPTVQDLAAAPEDQLMKLWQGLGYYSRARNLQKAARQIVEDFGGAFPTQYKDIRALAGVGDYTAAAIASICYGQPVPAVDGNLLRVASRVMGDDTDITTTQGKRRFTAALQQVIPLDEPGRFNQAMMDLGAMVCLPNGAPLCDRCPAAEFCRARQTGRQRDLPVRPAKKPRRVEERVVFLLFYQGQVALRRRPAKGLLAGLWEYPNELAPARDCPSDWGLPEEGTFAGTGKHIFTHVEWRMTARRWDLTDPALPEGWVWAGREALARDYPIPSAFASFQEAVEEGLL
ncbi:MAG TPA: A/G-specific adenine glycosylase [Candidatus Evtepia faecigallinarum]|nr:A/G-specific adenine glycosylase [Candidatus Evtepia faecigallinarum]